MIVDVLANEVITTQASKDYNSFSELPTMIRNHLHMNKSQIPNLRIRTRKINI